MNPKRVFHLNSFDYNLGPIIYWMSRDQRIEDNWALIFSQELALKYQQPLIIVFTLVDNFLNASIRHFSFMLKSLDKEANKSFELNIPFLLLKGNPSEEIIKTTNNLKAGALITDFDPLKIKKQWKNQVKEKIKIPFYEVDAHNTVPCRYISQKEEFAAYTLRPKIHKVIDEFLDEYPKIQKHIYNSYDFVQQNHSFSYDLKSYAQFPYEINWLIPGTEQAKETLDTFINEKLNGYAEFRNIPTLDYQSNLSPYLHFGQISAQRIALEIMKVNGLEESKKVFLEELIVRKELADNYCFYNENYDNFEGLQNWAKNTLNEERDSPRDYIYCLDEFENAKTHDELWNAAQLEMVKTGKMHGYLRMYWAKKILEWTKNPEDAIEIAIYLNDKYELDGRDPNGYTGIAWSIGGVHDRPWFPRKIFGKIRYMNYNGMSKKFNIADYIKKVRDY
ncbi:MAG: deoxyribodipyrimidine photo-lyase [Candidatus Kapabacteria bacterium]|nr:deoxyribodipyrimidine photo-lyase [Candidatus Kapabacteria bacterium]